VLKILKKLKCTLKKQRCTLDSLLCKKLLQKKVCCEWSFKTNWLIPIPHINSNTFHWPAHSRLSSLLKYFQSLVEIRNQFIREFSDWIFSNRNELEQKKGELNLGIVNTHNWSLKESLCWLTERRNCILKPILYWRLGIKMNAKRNDWTDYWRLKEWISPSSNRHHYYSTSLSIITLSPWSLYGSKGHRLSLLYTQTS
jgi:hypothetical protein